MPVPGSIAQNAGTVTDNTLALRKVSNGSQRRGSSTTDSNRVSSNDTVNGPFFLPAIDRMLAPR